MRLLFLTSSRADYGIYRPLLFKIVQDAFFELRMVVFGTHLSDVHGYTIKEIEEDGYPITHKISVDMTNDTPKGIALAMAKTSEGFVKVWEKEKKDIDFIIALGDRYEMFAAVNSSLPFNIPIVHIHGGETTLGAIDNTFRHCISLMSTYHFTSLKAYAEKVKVLTGAEKNVFHVGALSLDNLQNQSLYTVDTFREKFNIDLAKSSILVTFHPETKYTDSNTAYVAELIGALSVLKNNYQIIITLPNADTTGNVIRTALLSFAKESDNVYAVESFGSKGYMSCMKHCSLLLGNTSSGVIEAASFGKYVINIGNRQSGRLSGDNVFTIPIDKEEIINQVRKVEALPPWTGENIYWKKNVADQIISTLKSIKQ